MRNSIGIGLVSKNSMEKKWKPCGPKNRRKNSGKILKKRQCEVPYQFISIQFNFNSFIESKKLISNIYLWNELKLIDMELHTAWKSVGRKKIMRKNSKKLISKIHISVYSWIIITILDNEDFDLRNVEWNKYYSKQLVKMSIIKYICFFKCKKKFIL